MMPDKPTQSHSRHFGRSSLRILKEATVDNGYKSLRPTRDLAMLLTFIERFDRLGWFPPTDLEKRRLLAAHDVMMHVVRDDLCFYEFCSKGGRGERDPWLTIFFHVDAAACVRICGLERTEELARHREFYLSRIETRVKILTRHMQHKREE
jgi:hypothetical protein